MVYQYIYTPWLYCFNSKSSCHYVQLNVYIVENRKGLILTCRLCVGDLQARDDNGDGCGY